MREVWVWMKMMYLGENQQAGPLCIPWRMVDSELKYILGCCFSRADAKGENLLCALFQRRAAKAATERTAKYGSLIGPQIPLPYLKAENPMVHALSGQWPLG
jgi:hypothetical protein